VKTAVGDEEESDLVLEAAARTRPYYTPLLPVALSDDGPRAMETDIDGPSPGEPQASAAP
jgi:hypothetical protein